MGAWGQRVTVSESPRESDEAHVRKGKGLKAAEWSGQKNNMKNSTGEMIYGDVKLQQVSPAELLAVSRRDKRKQIGSTPDRQGDNPASVCVNKNATISPRLTTELTPLSVSRAPIIAHRDPRVSPPPDCLSRFRRREVASSGEGVRRHGCQSETMQQKQAARDLLVPLTP